MLSLGAFQISPIAFFSQARERLYCGKKEIEKTKPKRIKNSLNDLISVLIPKIHEAPDISHTQLLSLQHKEDIF